MNKTKYLMNPIKMGLVMGLLTTLIGCVVVGGGGYYRDGYYDDGGIFLFGGGHDGGREVHEYSHRGFESRGEAHPGGGGRR